MAASPRMQNGSKPGSRELNVEQFFTHHSIIRFVRLQWVDYSGVLRVRFLPKKRILGLFNAGEAYTVPPNCNIIPISTAPAYFANVHDDWKLLPDWETLAVCGFRPTHASVMCFTANTGLCLQPELSLCSREVLYEALQEYGNDILVGFEIEFMLLDGDDNIAESLDQNVGHYMSAGLRTGKINMMEQIVAALEVSGIDVYHFHVEGPGQYEIALSALPPLQAVDALVVSLETIRTICVQHGVRASAAPEPVAGGARNGLHMHLSLNNRSSKVASFFLAGVMNHLKALCAFGMANFDSYCRITKTCTGEWVGYGSKNKNLPVRKVSDTRWEFRCLDATANPYLFLAALVLAGTSGIKAECPPTSQDCPVMPPILTQDELVDRLGKLGITEAMPRSLAESMRALRLDTDLSLWMGEERLKEYGKVKDKEIEHFAGVDKDERRRKFAAYF